MIQARGICRIILAFGSRESLDHCRQHPLADFFNRIHNNVAICDSEEAQELRPLSGIVVRPTNVRNLVGLYRSKVHVVQRHSSARADHAQVHHVQKSLAV